MQSSIAIVLLSVAAVTAVVAAPERPLPEIREVVSAADVLVIDGDTIRLGRERIRILNIDAPELRGRMYAELAQFVAPKLKAIEHRETQSARMSLDSLNWSPTSGSNSTSCTPRRMAQE